MTPLRDITGQRFGSLVVRRRAPNGATGKVKWECDCDCGGSSAVAGHKLRAGLTISCGCLGSRRSFGARTRHLTTKHGLFAGGKRPPEYRSWDGAIQRCHNPDAKDFARYGGRGITVCDEWRNSLRAFMRDM